jgi:hypothetical protein
MAVRNLRWGSGAGSAFVMGMVVGLFVREAAQRVWQVARRKYTHRERERTVAYDDNLPDALERREPAPTAGQPRYGGTGAIGFSPAAVTPPSK